MLYYFYKTYGTILSASRSFSKFGSTSSNLRKIEINDIFWPFPICDIYFSMFVQGGLRSSPSHANQYPVLPPFYFGHYEIIRPVLKIAFTNFAKRFKINGISAQILFFQSIRNGFIFGHYWFFSWISMRSCFRYLSCDAWVWGISDGIISLWVQHCLTHCYQLVAH